MAAIWAVHPTISHYLVDPWPLYISNAHDIILKIETSVATIKWSDSMLPRDPAVRAGVIAGIIAATLVIVFIQPLLDILWSILVWFGKTVYEGYLNSIYRRASLGHTNYVSVIIFTFMISVLLGSGSFIITLTVPYVRTTIVPKIASRSSLRHKLYIASVIYFILFAILIMLVSFRLITDVQLNASFQQRLSVLTPRISDQERKELAAAWSSMQSRDDYEEIGQRMNILAKKHGITLPEPLVK